MNAFLWVGLGVLFMAGLLKIIFVTERIIEGKDLEDDWDKWRSMK